MFKYSRHVACFRTIIVYFLYDMEEQKQATDVIAVLRALDKSWFLYKLLCIVYYSSWKAGQGTEADLILL